MNETKVDNYMIMALIEGRFDYPADAFLDRLMWNLTFAHYQKIAFVYFNFKKNTAWKVFNESLASLAIELKIRNSLHPHRDDLQKHLYKLFLEKLKETKKRTQKYYFSEFIRRREAKLMKAKLSPL